MYLGIDIHKQYAQVAVMDENGEIDREVRVENANLDEIAQEYAGSEAAIEATDRVVSGLSPNPDIRFADKIKSVGSIVSKN